FDWFERGFVTFMRCSTGFYLDRQRIWERFSPYLQISFYRTTNDERESSKQYFGRIAENSLTNRFVSLALEELDDHFDYDALIGLIESPHLKSLRQLDIVECDIEADGIKALFESRLMDGLRRLQLSLLLGRDARREGVGDEAMQSLLAKPVSDRLEGLGFGHILTDNGVEQLLSSPHVSWLRQLYLGGSELSSRSLLALL